MQLTNSPLSQVIQKKKVFEKYLKEKIERNFK